MSILTPWFGHGIILEACGSRGAGKGEVPLTDQSQAGGNKCPRLKYAPKLVKNSNFVTFILEQCYVGNVGGKSEKEDVLR